MSSEIVVEVTKQNGVVELHPLSPTAELLSWQNRRLVDLSQNVTQLTHATGVWVRRKQLVRNRRLSHAQQLGSNMLTSVPAIVLALTQLQQLHVTVSCISAGVTDLSVRACSSTAIAWPLSPLSCAT